MKQRNGPDTHGRMRTVGRLAVRILLGLLAFSVVCIVVAGLLPLRNPKTAGGQNRVIVRYAAMDDGVRLAVYVALPPDLAGDGRVPAILETTRYKVMPHPSFLMRILGNFGIAKLGLGGKPSAFPDRLDYLRLGAYGHGVGAAMDAFLESGYAFVMASSRGSGASFGERRMELSPDEIADQTLLIEWIAAQEWSDGKVGAYGVSYSGNTAEMACADPPPALLAAAPFYSDFDPIGDNVLPGGILNIKLLRDWNAGNLADDAGIRDNPLLAAATPVDGRKGSRLLKEAYAGHKTLDLYSALRNLGGLDEKFGGGYTAADISPATYRNVIGASGIPLRIRAGWLDASTAGGALERFLTFPNAQELDIGPWGHGGFTYGDPFLLTDIGVGEPETAQSTELAQATELVDFFDRYLRDGADSRMAGKTLRYYTYGAGTWSTTRTWPPEGVRFRMFRFGPGRRLVEEEMAGAGKRSASDPADPAEATDAADFMTVDFSASTGETNRWRTNLGGRAVVYPDRAEEDEKLLYWDSEPLTNDREITGTPRVSLWIQSDAEDGAFHVYLEDVAPDGTVSYITEGLLRAIHRKPLDPDPLSGALGPRHSFLLADAAPLNPGEAAELKIALEPISVLLRAGHRIRIAVACADASNFVRIPAAGAVSISVLRDDAHPSFVELPFK